MANGLRLRLGVSRSLFAGQALVLLGGLIGQFVIQRSVQTYSGGHHFTSCIISSRNKEIEVRLNG